jgi:hypothetical protein
MTPQRDRSIVGWLIALAIVAALLWLAQWALGGSA